MKRIGIGLGLLALLVTAQPAVAATPPDRINYQGVLRDNDSNPLTGSYDAVFRFFDAESGGNEILVDEHLASGTGAVVVAGGMFSVHLGGGAVSDGAATLPGDPFDSLAKVFGGFSEVWLQIEIDPGTSLFEVLSPRVQVVAAAYALNAGSLGGADASEYLDTSLTPQTKAGNLFVNDLTLNGNDVWFANGAKLSSSATALSINGGADDTDRLILRGGNSGDDGNIDIQGQSYISLRAGNGQFQFWHGAVNTETARLEANGSLQLDGDLTVSGNDIFFGNGGSIGDAATYTLLRGSAAADDLHLYAGTSASHGSISIFGSGDIDLRAGGGSTRFGRADGTLVAAIDNAGNMDLDGELEIGTATANDRIVFGSVESLTWDNSQTRFEFSDRLLAASLDINGDTITPVGYNRFGSGTPDASGDITANNDVLVAGDLEVADRLYIGKTLVAGDLSPTTNQAFSSFGEASLKDEAIISDVTDVYIQGELEVDGLVFANLVKSDADTILDFRADRALGAMIDNDNSGTIDEAEWFHNGTYGAATKIGSLQEDGDLLIRGTLSQNYSFDIAEAYLALEELEPGDLVAVDASRGDAVRRTRDAGDAAVIGVVSGRPGVLLGAAPFDIGALEASWGAEVRALFGAERSRLREQILAEAPELELELQELDAAALKRLETRLEGQVLQRFHDERFVAVALAGRVPVNVDGSAGAIAPGDPLAPGPLPGVAVRATAPGPVVGIALEAFAGDRGQVLAFVSRDFYTPAAELGSIREEQRTLADRIDAGTPDPSSGVQAVPGHLQVVLDRDADDDARFSIHRDGEQGSLGAEVFRVDEEGNVFARGAFSPSSMDVAEFFPVVEPVQAGDVLVADRNSADRYSLCREAGDAAVIGVVAASPGVILGRSVERIAAVDPDLALRLEEARRSADNREEARLWQELRAKFRAGHAPVSLAGTVPVRVDAGFGEIRVGDLLTTSPTPGHAMRADDPMIGTILGKALEPLDSGTGRVKMLVMLR